LLFPLHVLPTFEHKEYFVNHDVWRLPYQFVNRMGEISKSMLCMDTIQAMNRAVRIFSEAEKDEWAMGEKLFEPIGPAITDQIAKGVEFRFMGCENSLPNFIRVSVSGAALHVELKTLTDVSITIVCTEKDALICFPSTEGRMEYAAFFGKDQLFVNWARDIFLHYWEIGKNFKQALFFTKNH
jgi:predicted transcriptional regulator